MMGIKLFGFLTMLCGGVFYASPLFAADDRPPASEWGMAARVISVYDGDTIKVIAYPWPLQTIETNIRLEGIDTPEINGACDSENTRAMAAHDRLITLAGNIVYLRNIQTGRFANRVIARIYTATGEDITTILPAEQHGRPWAGHRASWCD